MRTKDVLKNLAALAAAFVTGLSASVALFYYFEDTLNFANEAALPENPTAYALGGFFGASLGILFNVLLTLLFLILVFILGVKIRPSLLLFPKKERSICKIVRILGYAAAIWLAFCGIHDWIQYKVFLLTGLWYYTSAIAALALYIVIIESVLSR